MTRLTLGFALIMGAGYLLWKVSQPVKDKTKKEPTGEDIARAVKDADKQTYQMGVEKPSVSAQERQSGIDGGVYQKDIS